LVVAFARLEPCSWLLVAALLVAPLSATSGIPHGANGLNEPPAPRPGDWWRVRVTDHRTDEVREGTMVALQRPTGIGIGIDEGSLHPLFFNNHVLPLGSEGGLESFLVHGQRFEPLRFPLEPGATWPTQLGLTEVLATVGSVTSDAAQITFEDANGKQWGKGTYDASIGWFSSLVLDHYSEMQVLDHGTDFSCTAVFPAGLSVPHPLDPPVSVPAALAWKQAFAIPSEHDLALVTMVTNQAGGAARQQAFAPDGTVYETGADPSRPIDALYTINHAPAGMWTVSAQGTADAFAGFYLTSFHSERHTGPSSHPCTPAIAVASVATAPPPRWATSFDATGRIALLGILFLGRHWRKAGWLAIRLFSRLDAGDVEKQPVRQKILETLSATNGLTTQALRLRIGVGWGTVNHHLAVLERNGKVLHVRSGRHQTWMSAATKPTDVPRLAALSAPQLKRVYQALLDSPGMTQADLARRLALDPSTVNHHARKLADLGLLRRETAGRRIRLFVNPSP
jgi:predicted transcriptional regulator